MITTCKVKFLVPLESCVHDCPQRHLQNIAGDVLLWTAVQSPAP